MKYIQNYGSKTVVEANTSANGKAWRGSTYNLYERNKGRGAILFCGHFIGNMITRRMTKALWLCKKGGLFNFLWCLLYYLCQPFKKAIISKHTFFSSFRLPRSIWSSRAGDQMWASVVNYTAATATPDFEPHVPGWGSNLCPRDARKLPVRCGNLIEAQQKILWACFLTQIINKSFEFICWTQMENNGSF